MIKKFNLSKKINTDPQLYPSQWIEIYYIKEFIEWCDIHGFYSEGIKVISIEKLKEGAGEKLK